MRLSKIVLLGSIVLFGAIGTAALVKKREKPPEKAKAPALAATTKAYIPAPVASQPIETAGDFPMIDRVHQLFTKGPTKLPIVETITYSSKVSWLKGRPAWISDYAVFYGTSRHFIARGLNGKPDYFNQRVSEGSQFNVLRKDKNIQFYLLVDTTLCKMGFYYVDIDSNERLLLKTYRVGLPRPDMLPLGSYPLGSKIVVSPPGPFGTRWIPLDQTKGCSLCGAPWTPDGQGELVERRDIIGKYEGERSIRLSSEDIEELFSIVITKPTIVEISSNFKDVKLPGIEVATPVRK